MKVFQYLFFLYQDTVTVIAYDKYGEKKFSYITAQGEKKFPVTDDFWSWWKGQTSYISGELIDFCFIYDRELPV